MGANSVEANKNMQIKKFNDPNLRDGIFLVNLCAAVDPSVVDWSNVYTGDIDDEKKGLNSKYAISLARKMGAIIFMVWEDVLEGNTKMMTIFMCSLYELYNEARA